MQMGMIGLDGDGETQYFASVQAVAGIQISKFAIEHFKISGGVWF